jgi:hypothetical protein
LFPELDLGQLAVEPTVADDAVRVRRGAGQVSGLRSAGDGGKCGFDSGFIAARREFANARGVLTDKRVRKADDIDDGGASHLSSGANDFMAALLMSLLQFIECLDDFWQVHVVNLKAFADLFEQGDG